MGQMIRWWLGIKPMTVNQAVSKIQMDIDSEHGIRPPTMEPRDSYRKLSELPASWWLS